MIIPIIPEDPIVTITQSSADAVTVVFIDTDEQMVDMRGVPVLRVYLNDSPIFENPVFPNACE